MALEWPLNPSLIIFRFFINLIN